MCDICDSSNDVQINDGCKHRLCGGCRYKAVVCPVGECLCRLSLVSNPACASVRPEVPCIECTKCNARFSLSAATLLIPHPHSMWCHETAPAPPETTGEYKKLLLPTTKIGAHDKCIHVHGVTDKPQIYKANDLELHVTRCTIHVYYCHRNMIMTVNARDQYMLLRGAHGATLPIAGEITTIMFRAAVPLDNTSLKLSPCRLLAGIASEQIPIGILAAADYMYYTHPRYNNMLVRRTLIGAVETHVQQAMCTYHGIQCAFCGRVWCGDTAFIASKCKFHCGIADVPEAALHMIMRKSEQRPVIDATENCFDPLPSVRPASPLAPFFAPLRDDLQGGKPGVIASIDNMVMCLGHQRVSLPPEESVPLFLDMCNAGWEATSIPYTYAKDKRKLFTYNINQFHTAETF